MFQGKATRQRDAGAPRFMESFHDCRIAHWDHEPLGLPGSAGVSPASGCFRGKQHASGTLALPGSWSASAIAESRIGTMNRWAFLGALASRRRVDVSRGKQHASGTLALPGSWKASTIAESRIGTMNRWAFLGAPASRRRVDVSRGKQHASGTLALPGSWKENESYPRYPWSNAAVQCFASFSFFSTLFTFGRITIWQ